jgi:hypothetical protein
LGTRASNVPKGADRQYWISSHNPDSSFSLGVIQKLCKVSALKGFGIVSFPNVIVAFWIELPINPAFLFQNIGKPRIVAPVGLDTDRIWWISPHELIDRILLAPRVP